MKFGTGNILKGRVVEIKEEMNMTRVKVDLGGGEIITAMVTDAALKELDAKVGDELEVLKGPGAMAPRNFH
ncbi:MAG: TOBE domain-containing protein [Desulfobaccales bacterium]